MSKIFSMKPLKEFKAGRSAEEKSMTTHGSREKQRA